MHFILFCIIALYRRRSSYMRSYCWLDGHLALWSNKCKFGNILEHGYLELLFRLKMMISNAPNYLQHLGQREFMIIALPKSR
ncbi:hypothetical protein CVS40_1641 [Lucilia cuprina]|nr:hypothetical protein CVS40_1641 [Lucilia cuprina]